MLQSVISTTTQLLSYVPFMEKQERFPGLREVLNYLEELTADTTAVEDDRKAAFYLQRQMGVLKKCAEEEASGKLPKHLQGLRIDFIRTLNMVLPFVIKLKNGNAERNRSLSRIFAMCCFIENLMPELAKLSGEYTDTELKEMLSLVLELFKKEHNHETGHITDHGDNYNTMKHPIGHTRRSLKSLVENPDLLNEFVEMNNQVLVNIMIPKSSRPEYYIVKPRYDKHGEYTNDYAIGQENESGITDEVQSKQFQQAPQTSQEVEIPA